MTLRFLDGREFDAATGELRHDGVVTRVEPQPAALLVLLAARPGTLVTYDEIRRAVWTADTHVDFRQGMQYGVRHLRQALGDVARPPRIIETIPKRGYRLRADALAPSALPTPVPAVPGAKCPGQIAPGTSRRLRWVVAAGGFAAAVALVAVVERRPNHHHEIAVALLQAVHDLVY